MKTNIATDLCQSQRLLRCGVSPDTADMHWYGAIVPRGGSLTSMPEPSEEWDLGVTPYSCMPEEMQTAKLMEDYNEIVPAWSLSALLGLIPPVIEVYDDGVYYRSLAKEFPASEDYHAAYKYCWTDDDVIVCKRSSCPVEACVQLIEWLKEKNYKLNEQ